MKKRDGHAVGCGRSGRRGSWTCYIWWILSLLTLSSLLLIVIFFHMAEEVASKTKTVVGHNLEATPWHPFPLSTTSSGSKYDIFRCSYLTCPFSPAKQQLQPEEKTKKKKKECPAWFGWIHEDLTPWRGSGITRSKLEEARSLAAFRIIISGGRLYTEMYYACVQSRTMFTVWGFLQLLRRYPGSIPDVDLMFDCMDRPLVHKANYNTTSSSPPPLFRYCTTKHHFDIPFPDWSFWGWPEVNIDPWGEEFRSIKLGSQSLTWSMRHDTAYWKGNPDVGSPIRTELMHCNDSIARKAQIIRQDWVGESTTGFQQSKLSNQCDHRYKIYAEGFAWSVSLKYILSCGSLALMINPQYEDFFSRGLLPRKHYWHTRSDNLCESIKFAVDWGNEHPMEAEGVGKEGQAFMQDLDMGRVYEYMYHLIVEYSKLQDFKPVPPPSAHETCERSILCFADKQQSGFLENSYALSSSSLPCTLGQPDRNFINSWLQEKQRRVDILQELEMSRLLSG
ncbi:hypothetical protein QJS10_CPB19g02027 [Acorus calamus]|uniref:Glycosyl transferase CAP10 domain-containing protein n=1 Tax=Acorus calamus TaxID=4465 RepID=A0AAV9CI81_ACOCL|nr:hypothetical protein QJS10_CPB19g02027 [Acorus calamus]